MWQRVYALFVARNTEFFRDRSALAWSVLMPVLIIVGFSYAFTEENPAKFKVALYANEVSNAAAENFQAARSRILDADIASESAELVRTQILQQAASAVLAQANQQPALALQLLG